MFGVSQLCGVNRKDIEYCTQHERYAKIALNISSHQLYLYTYTCYNSSAYQNPIWNTTHIISYIVVVYIMFDEQPYLVLKIIIIFTSCRLRTKFRSFFNFSIPAGSNRKYKFALLLHLLINCCAHAHAHNYLRYASNNLQII